MFKGLETYSPRMGIVCLIKQSRRAWNCTWEGSRAASLPVQQSLALDSHLFLVPFVTEDPLVVGNVLDPNQGHGGHGLGLMSAFAMFVEGCLLVNLNMLVFWAWEKRAKEGWRGVCPPHNAEKTKLA